jgi:hypothetical protein
MTGRCGLLSTTCLLRSNLRGGRRPAGVVWIVSDREDREDDIFF